MAYNQKFLDEAKKKCRLGEEIRYDNYRRNIGSKRNNNVMDVSSGSIDICTNAVICKKFVYE